MLQTSNLAVVFIFVQLFSFLVFTKCEVLNLRVGRSCDPLINSSCKRPILWDRKVSGGLHFIRLSDAVMVSINVYSFVVYAGWRLSIYD